MPTPQLASSRVFRRRQMSAGPCAQPVNCREPLRAVALVLIKTSNDVPVPGNSRVGAKQHLSHILYVTPDPGHANGFQEAIDQHCIVVDVVVKYVQPIQTYVHRED